MLGVKRADLVSAPASPVSRAKDAETAAKESAAKAAAILEKEVVAPPLSRKALTVLLRYIAGQVDKLPEGIVAMTPGYKENVRGVGRASKAATTMGSDTATVAATFAVTAQGTATSTWGSIAQVRFVEKASLLCSFFLKTFCGNTPLQRVHSLFPCRLFPHHHAGSRRRVPAYAPAPRASLAGPAAAHCKEPQGPAEEVRVREEADSTLLSSQAARP